MGLERIVGEAASKLTSKTFGGVSKESAMEAIKAASVLLRDGITQFHINIIGQENTEYKTFISNFIRCIYAKSNISKINCICFFI